MDRPPFGDQGGFRHTKVEKMSYGVKTRSWVLAGQEKLLLMAGKVPPRKNSGRKPGKRREKRKNEVRVSRPYLQIN